MPGPQAEPVLVPATLGAEQLRRGVVVAWRDGRSGTDDILAQKLDESGNRLWDTTGVMVCGAAFDQWNVQIARGFDPGGALLAWVDQRAFPAPADLYVQSLDSLGAPVPNPAQGTVRMSLELPASERVSAEVFDMAGRRVRRLDAGAWGAGRHTLIWDGRGDDGREVAPGIYLVRVSTPAGEARARGAAALAWITLTSKARIQGGRLSREVDHARVSPAFEPSTAALKRLPTGRARSPWRWLCGDRSLHMPARSWGGSPADPAARHGTGMGPWVCRYQLPVVPFRRGPLAKARRSSHTRKGRPQMKTYDKAAFAAVLGLMLLLSSVAVTSGSTVKLPLGSSSEIPAAEGEAQIHPTRNGNIEIKLRVKHLAPPGRISPGAEVFVVWARGLEPGAEAQNLGALKVDKNLNAKFTTVTAMASFDLFLTCEQAQTALYPSRLELLPVRYPGR